MERALETRVRNLHGMMAKATLNELIAPDAGDADDGAFGFDHDVLRLDAREVELYDPSAGRAIDIGPRREIESTNLLERVVLHARIVAKWSEGLT